MILYERGVFFMSVIESNVKEYSLRKGRSREDNGEDDKDVTWLVFENNKIIIEVSKFLELKGINSSRTSKAYGKALISFFRYLNIVGKDYENVGKKDIYGYILHLAKPKDLKDKKTVNTIKQYVSIVSVFYDWLVEERDDFKSPIPRSNKPRESKRSINKNSFLYGQVWDFDKDLRDRLFPKIKDKVRINHKKWYSEKEIEVLSKSFNKRRDKVIFLTSVKLGCRIDEILSIREEDYDSNNQSIYIRESKTLQRYLYVPKELCEEIDRYIQTERRDVETELGLLDYLFVNLRKDSSYGKKVDPQNYLKLLKGYAEKVGFDPKEIITHAGRSTKAQELIEQQVLDENSGISDALIMEIMGWSNIDSIKPYKKQSNLKIQKAVSAKIKQRKRKDKDNE